MRWLAGIRARLFALVLLGVIPALALEIYDTREARNAAIAEAREHAAGTARQVAEDLETRIDGAHHLLAALTQVPAVRQLRQPQCSELLAELQKQAKRYANFLVTDRSGTSLCSAVPAARPVSYADRDFFQAVLKTRRPVVGHPVLGRVTRIPVLPVAHPVLDAGGEVEIVVVIGLDLAWIGNLFARSAIPQGGALTLWDADGHVMYRHPDNEKWAGTLNADAEIVKELRASREARIVEATGLDGLPRVHAVVPFKGFGDLGITVGFSVTTATIVAEADAPLRRDLASLAAIALAALGAAWFLGEVLIRRRFAALARAAREVGAGRLEARVGAPYAAGELGDLARSFDAMADNLQRQHGALAQALGRLERANRTLRTLSETNQALIRATDETALLERACRIAVKFGGYRMAWIGFAEHDAQKSVRPVAWHGVESAYLESLRITWADEARGRGPTGSAIRTGKLCIARNVLDDPAYAPWRAAALEHGYASSIALPLRTNGDVLGALNLYAAEADAFDAEELKLLAEMADDLSFGIATLRAREARERAEAENRLHATALDAAANGILITDSDGAILWANRAMTALTGYGIDELRGANPRLFKSGRHDAAFYRALHETVRSGAIWRGEIVNRRKDGGLYTEEMTITPVRAAGDAITHFIAVKHDITERRRAEDEIRALNANLERRVAERTSALAREVEERKLAQAELDRYFNVTRDLFCIAGFDGHFKRINPAWEKTLGWSAAELLARPFAEFVHPEDRGTTAAAAAQLAEGRDIVSFENRYRCKDGSYRWLLWSSTPVPALQVINAVARDVTEQKRLEADLQAHTRLIARKNVELEQANAMKSKFLANMSHELRTPLNAIIGFSEILKDGIAGPLEAQQKDFIADIHNGGQHLLALINDILDLSKVEAGMMALEPEPVAIERILPASLSVVKERALKHRLHLALSVDPALGSFAADPRKLKQIVYNLLSNAVKFTPDGGSVSVAARRMPRAAVALPEGVAGMLVPPADDGAAEFCEIAVTDSGIGIAAEHLDKLFQPFVQIDSSLARKYEGTGLGLSMVKNLAQLHGGAVGVTSEPGRGSRFTVWLPLRETVLPTVAASPRQAPRPELRASTRPLALVIEDDDATAQLIELQLKSEGFDTMRAATAEEGMVRAAKRPPQLITLDIFLPRMDGWDFLSAVKADPRLAEIPVVIISVADDLEHGVSLGARRVLHKPLLKEELHAAIAGIGLAPREGGAGKVLVIDDNPVAVELLDAQLAAAGFDVLRAYGGKDGVALAGEVRPDLILLDLMMPDMSGFEVVEALQHNAGTASIPVLVVTSKDLTAEDRAALNGYVTQVVRKAGFNREQFLAEVRRAMGRAHGGEPGRRQ